jgi:hypothetical protein
MILLHLQPGHLLLLPLLLMFPAGLRATSAEATQMHRL